MSNTSNTKLSRTKLAHPDINILERFSTECFLNFISQIVRSENSGQRQSCGTDRNFRFSIIDFESLAVKSIQYFQTH